MLCINIHLPQHRLKLTLTKRRTRRGEKTKSEKFRSLFAARKGSRFSRFFRNVFEQRRIKAFFGGNLTLFALVASSLNPSARVNTVMASPEPTVLSATATEFTTTTAVRLPTEKKIITQRFSVFHPGLDLDGVTGDPIYPVMKGIVESVIYDRVSYGIHIIINHGSNIKSLYAHLSKILVSAGQQVDTNTVIGKMGATGHAFGDHLHFEITENGRRINPLTVLP